ncbi:helix-turn-helix transcriptional regulator, partial [Mycetocola reblochoni]|uniref:helix-turn-helix transcriptional regulator n=1 Tax=Mycetocola reblochoni TaxID=331618 RepID=UPI0023EA4D05
PVLFPPTAVDSVERVTLPPLTPGQELAAAVLHRLGPQSYRAASRHVGDDAVDALIQHGVLRPLDDGMIQVAPLIGATLRLRHDAPVEELRRSALLLAAAWNRGETLSPDELVLLAEMELSPGALRDAGLLTARAAAIAHQQGAHAEARALLATAEATAPRRTAVVRAFAEAVRTASDTQPLRLVDGERQADGVAEDDDPVLHRNECYLRGIIRSWSAHPASPRALTAPETVIELWSEQEPYSVGADADATLSRIAADPATDSSTRCWALALALGASAHRDDRRRVEELLPLARHTRREHTSAGWVPEDYYAADADAVLWLTIRLVVQLSGAAESHPDDGWGGAAWTATAPGGPDSRIRRTGAYVLRALDALASGREDIVVANVERLLRSLTRHSFAGLNRTIIHICRWITLPETLLPPDRRGVPRTRRRNAELDGVADALALAEQASSPARPVGEPQTPEWMLTLAEFRLALAEDGYWLRLADGLPPIDGATEPPTVAALLSALRSSLRDDEEIALICDRLVAQRNPLAAAHVLELGRRLAIADGREETALACAIWRDRLGFRARDDAGVGVGAAGGRRVASSPFDAAERAAASTVAGPLPPVAPTWAPPASPSGPRSGRADEDPRPVDGARRTRPSATVPGPRSELSAREKEICGLIALGLRNKEIAARLHLSVRTVESHVLQARSKLGARRRTDIPSLLRAENELSANS